jgi:anaerobic ribonucleoside-triphosphate reductase activating protein
MATCAGWCLGIWHISTLNTFFGGEPMLQAQGVAVVAEGAQKLGLSVMVFSGYTRTEIDDLRLPGSYDLLRHTDVLVDGPYEKDLPELTRHWVGSTNQQFHYLTNRYDAKIENLGTIDRACEFRFRSDGTVFINGWPEKIEPRN